MVFEVLSAVSVFFNKVAIATIFLAFFSEFMHTSVFSTDSVAGCYAGLWLRPILYSIQAYSQIFAVLATGNKLPLAHGLIIIVKFLYRIGAYWLVVLLYEWQFEVFMEHTWLIYSFLWLHVFAYNFVKFTIQPRLQSAGLLFTFMTRHLQESGQN